MMVSLVLSWDIKSKRGEINMYLVIKGEKKRPFFPCIFIGIHAGVIQASELYEICI